MAAPNDTALDAGFCPIKVLVLTAKMPSPELGVGHGAALIHHATWRSGGGVAARGARAAKGAVASCRCPFCRAKRRRSLLRRASCSLRGSIARHRLDRGPQSEAGYS